MINMQDSFAKIARKPAKDPEQEKLRAHKSGWNDVASLLIAKLIAFKRGLNGAGDARADIPPSKITEPLPDELDVYLTSIIKDYSDLVQGAKFIMNEQEDYSEKFSHKSAAEEFNFQVEASSALSRAWARIGLIGDENRKLRISLLNAFSDLIPDLHNMENDLTSRDKNGHARVVYDLNKFLITLKSDINPFIQLLRAEQLEPSSAPSVPAHEMPGNEQTSDQTSEQGGATVYREKAPQVVNFQEHLLEGLNRLKENIDEVALRSKILKKKYPEAPDLTPKAIELSRLEVEIRNLISEDPLGLIANHLDALVYLQQEYNQMVGILQQYPVSKDEIQDMLSLDDIRALDQERKELEKVAHNTITRWIQRKMLSLNPGPGGLTVLRAVNSLRNSIYIIDNIMDLLETRSADLTEVASEYNNLIKHLTSLTEDVLSLGRIHILRKKKFKDKDLLGLNKSDLNDLEKSINAISL